MNTLPHTFIHNTLLRNVRAIGFHENFARPLDIWLENGRVRSCTESTNTLPEGLPQDVQLLDCTGLYLSSGWVDLHTHIYHGATDISVRSRDIGIATGVTTLVDAGSAGEANFTGLREYVADVAKEQVLAILNVGSIGLVACNRVSELINHRSIDVDRTLDCIEQNRDLIRGVKVRASGVIVGDWGIAPAKIAKKIARIAGLPLMVHVGEVPPLVEEVFELLTEGDIVTHCFHGKRGGNLMEDPTLFTMARQLADKGVFMDLGHGAASFSYKVGKAAMAQGFFPTTISSDLHLHNINGPVWDLSLVMSKILNLGMDLEAVIECVTVRPKQALREAFTGLLATDARANFTLFGVEDDTLEMPDAEGNPLLLKRVIRARKVFLDAEVYEAGSRWQRQAQLIKTIGAQADSLAPKLAM